MTYVYITSLNVDEIEEIITNAYNQYSSVTFIIDINVDNSFTMSDLWDIRPLIGKFRVHSNEKLKKVVIVAESQLHRSMIQSFLFFVDTYCEIEVVKEFKE